MKRVHHINIKTNHQSIKVTLEVTSRGDGWDRPGFIGHAHYVSDKASDAIRDAIGARNYQVKAK